MEVSHDRIIGSLMGTAIGDALGMPAEGMPAFEVEKLYGWIDGYQSDRKRRDLRAGQWTDDTQATFALAQALTKGTQMPEAMENVASAYVAALPVGRRWGHTSLAAVERLTSGAPPDQSGDDEHSSNGAAMRAAPLGAWWAAEDVDRRHAIDFIAAILGITHRHPIALIAGFCQASAIREVLRMDGAAFDGGALLTTVLEVCRWTEGQFGETRALTSEQLSRAWDARSSPRAVAEVCHGAGVNVVDSWPLSIVMFAREAQDIEKTLLETVNLGGDADTTGAMVGALLGGLHGWSAFSERWTNDLEQVDHLRAIATRFADALDR